MSPSQVKPAAFLSAIHSVTEALSTPAVRARFPGAEVLGKSPEAEAACAGMPVTLLPLFLERQQSTWDIYAFDLCSPEPQRIVAWNDHAVVAEWPTFDAFLKWMHRA